MALFSFIDNANKDFLRYDDGNVVIVEFDTYTEAEGWLLTEGSYYGWTNTGIKYFNWNLEF